MNSFTFNSFLVLVCFIALNNIQQSFGMTEEMIELANMLHKSCQEETGAPEDAISNCRKGDFAEDPKLKCYIFCLMDQMAVIDEDGTVDEEGMLAVMPDEFKGKAESMIKGCGTKRGVDACDTAFQTHKCYYAASPPDYFLP